MLNKLSISSTIFHFLVYVEPIVVEMLLGFLIYLYPPILGNDIFVYPVLSTDEINIWKRWFGIMLFCFGGLHLSIMHLITRENKDANINTFLKNAFRYVVKNFIAGEIFIICALSYFYLCPWGEKQVNYKGIVLTNVALLSMIGLRSYTLLNIDSIYTQV
jgi:hypothetical protein